MTLLLPALIHGRYRDVKPRLRKIVKRMLRGDDWIAAVEEHGMLDVATTPGLIVLRGPSPDLGSDEHFQMWLLWAMVRDRDMTGMEGILENIFTESLTRPWTVLGLVMPANTFWLDEPRHHRFLRAVCPHWETFCSVGKRYTWGWVGDELWNCNHTVRYVMANQKLPLDIVDAPPQPGALAAFLRSHGIDVVEPSDPQSS